MRTTTVERMLFDICSLTSPGKAGRAMDEALIRRLTAISRLRSEEELHRRCRGAKTFRALLEGRDDRDGRIRSEMERRMLTILRRIKTHRVQADHAVICGGSRYVLDFAFPDMRIAIECHSFRWHAAGDAFQRDSERHRRLTLDGWTVLYYTWDDIVFEQDRILAEAKQLLASSLSL